MSNWRETRTITLTTAANGSCLAYSPVFNGEIEWLQFSDTAEFTGGFTATVTIEATGETLWSQADPVEGQVFRPALPVTGADGTEDPAAKTGIGYGPTRVSIALSNAGDTKVGYFKIGIKGSFSGA